MQVVIDKNSGFCAGVVNAIKKAEEELAKGQLYCIGDIVHNNLEVERLKEKGLVTIDHKHFEKLRDCRVLFRAHGEPPSSYRNAQVNNIEVIDASCPVVLFLQRQIREAYEDVKNTGGQIVIYGKKGHAEVVGLVGQTNGEALVVEEEKDIEQIHYGKPVILFSQTTKDLDGFRSIAELVCKKGGGHVTVHDTICRKVANRIPQLAAFAKENDVILFVGGEKSSNGKQLYAVCKKVNKNTFFVSGTADISPEMFKNAEKIGISGATSTPLWIMENVKNHIVNIVY